MSAPCGYRRLLVSMQLIQMAIVNGARCCVPKDVPKDLRVVCVAMSDERTVDLLVASETFSELPAPGESDVFVPVFRRMDCGYDRMQLIEEAAGRLREIYIASIDLMDVGGPRPLARAKPEEVLAQLDEILRLASGHVEEGPAGGAGPDF